MALAARQPPAHEKRNDQQIEGPKQRYLTPKRSPLHRLPWSRSRPRLQEFPALPSPVHPSCSVLLLSSRSVLPLLLWARSAGRRLRRTPAGRLQSEGMHRSDLACIHTSFRRAETAGGFTAPIATSTAPRAAIRATELPRRFLREFVVPAKNKRLFFPLCPRTTPTPSQPACFSTIQGGPHP